MFQSAGEDFPYTASRSELNEYLERWYNAPQPDGSIGEPLTLVPYQFWSKKLPKVVQQEARKAVYLSLIPNEIQVHVKEEIARMAKRLSSEIQPEMRLFADLRFDSLDIQEIITFLEENYGSKYIKPRDLVTVQQAMERAYLADIETGEDVEDESLVSSWKQLGEHVSLPPIQGDTLIEAFLKMAAKKPNMVICADKNLGEYTYKKLTLMVVILAQKIQKMPGDKIGILMPSTVLVNAMILACILAKKVPVMVNWTVGTRHLDALLELTDIQVVLSANKFVETLREKEIQPIEHLIRPIEKIRKRISIFDKLRGLLRSKKSVHALLKSFDVHNLSKHADTVILFTSGSEKMPKGVPLTHDNILSNMRSGLSRVHSYHSDVILGFLPPFHSFGFSVTGLLPLLTGMRVYYYANPTHYKSMASLIKHREVSFLCGAPTFLKGIFNAGDVDFFKHLRIVISGAEQAPESLIEQVRHFNKDATFLEGYGITECAPILTLNLPEKPSVGVGPPLPGIEIKIIDIDTNAPVAQGKEGQVVAKGPNIFKGYMGNHTSPFIKLEGQQWYLTGDMGFVNQDNYLTLTGRLKRLVKVGGEIVSLTALEAALTKAVIEKAWINPRLGISLAVCAKEVSGARPEIIIFMTFDATVEELNRLAKKAGFSNLYRIANVEKIKEIPLMATGKIHYRKLEEKL